MHLLNVSYVAVVWQLSSRADSVSSLFWLTGLLGVVWLEVQCSAYWAGCGLS